MDVAACRQSHEGYTDESLPGIARGLRLGWILCVVAVVVGSVASASGPIVQMLGRAHLGDKLEHFTAYAILAALPALRRFRCRNLGPTLLSLFLVGAALEVAQLFSPGRSCDWHDLLANSCGILTGVTVVRGGRKMVDLLGRSFDGGRGASAAPPTG